MDIQRVKATVKKITRLLDQIKDEASVIEKDLVLDYLREAYDLVLESSAPLTKKDSTIGITPHAINPNIPSQRDTPTPAVPIASNPNMPSQRDTPAPATPIASNPNMPSQRDTPAPATESPALLQLFQPLTANDLSEKLGTQPIRSLKNAFSINDRLLITNELFENNAEIFADTLKMVDNYESWEPAKSVLLNLASQFHWEKGEKSEIAKQFIKTIQRKFT